VRGRRDVGLWLAYTGTAVVGLAAAYMSYQHARLFALRFGAEPVTAAIWPLIVDGLLTVATVELWKSATQPAPASTKDAGAVASSSGRWKAWLSFLFSIGLSLLANIASAPDLSPMPISVAASRLMAGETDRAVSETVNENSETSPRPGGTLRETGETSIGTARPANETAQARPDDATPLRGVAGAESAGPARPGRRSPTAKRVMWEYFWRQRGAGRTPTGAELDRIAGTNNYGRRVVRRWRIRGHLAPVGALPSRATDAAAA